MRGDRADIERLLSPDEDLAALREPGIIRVIRLKPQELPAKRGAKPLTVEYVIKVAAGERARALDRIQAAAILDFLRWAAAHRAAEDGQQAPKQAPSQPQDR